MPERWIAQMRKGVVELCVLAVLEEKEGYGYGIVRDLQEVEALAFTESTVYPVLARLTKDRFLKVRVVDSPDGPRRRYYALTAAGRRRLAEMRIYWRALTDDMGRLLARPKKGRG